MGLTIKNLAAVTFDTGKTLPASWPYKPPSGKCGLVKNIILTNKSTTTAATVNVTLVRGADDTPNKNLGTTNLCPLDLTIPPKSSMVLDAEITLAYVDVNYEKIQVTLESGSGLPFGITINGIERDI